MEERRKKLEVHDKPTEVGIKLNNVLTALVLMVMSWVGYNIDQMKNQISTISTATAVNSSEIDSLRKSLEYHIYDKEIHNYK